MGQRGHDAFVRARLRIDSGLLHPISLPAEVGYEDSTTKLATITQRRRHVCNHELILLANLNTPFPGKLPATLHRPPRRRLKPPATGAALRATAKPTTAG